jgi:hypothetical protein
MIIAWANFWASVANLFQITSNVTNGGVVITQALVGKAQVVATDIDMECDTALHARAELRKKLGLVA